MLRSRKRVRLSKESRVPSKPLETLSLSFENDVLQQKQSQREYQIPSNYIKLQLHLTEHMRMILIDWLMEVSHAFLLRRETFYYTIHYIDRYLATTADVPKTQFQLIGLTALMIATKLEELYPPAIDDFIQLADFAYTPADLVAMEKQICLALEWKFHPATPYAWLTWYSRNNSTDYAIGVRDPRVFDQAIRLLDIATIFVKHLQFLPSVLALCALAIVSDPSNSSYPDVSVLDNSQDIKACLKFLRPFYPYLPTTQLPMTTHDRIQHQIPLADNFTLQHHFPGSLCAVYQVAATWSPDIPEKENLIASPVSAQSRSKSSNV